ncbi:MAG: hypothetical protein Fur0025_18120 [Oscillatoriaceae cyanobacterium]
MQLGRGNYLAIKDSGDDFSFSVARNSQTGVSFIMPVNLTFNVNEAKKIPINPMNMSSNFWVFFLIKGSVIGF